MKGTTTVASHPDEYDPGALIGPYKLIRQIGEGGMGVVYHAQQLHPIRRDVALKIIKPGMDTREVIARFESERQALAIMDHPNIARIFDAGTTSTGRPYFVMEKVDGTPINRYCDSLRLTIRQRIELFIPVCQAIQHAHQKGVIHRDLKPSNVLVALDETEATPKVIDFGLAKALGSQLSDATMVTNLGTIMGTPQYMSPEQAQLGRHDIDTRTDVYSLGAILYELLTGAPALAYPHMGSAGYLEVLQQIREAEPLRPSTRFRRSASPEAASQRRSDPARLRKVLLRELDWIVMKALAKDRARRYETVNGLVRDLQRYLQGEAVEAGPPSAAYRVRKLMAKYRLWLGVAAAFVALLTAGVVVSAWMALRAGRAEAEARAISDFLQNDLLAQAGASSQARPDTKPDPNLTVRTALERAASRVEGKFATQPAVEAAIRQTIGTTYFDLGLYPEAKRQLERALELRNRTLGEAHTDTLKTMASLTEIYGMEGKYVEAEALNTKTLQIQRRDLGEDHAETLLSMDNLGSIYRRQGKYSQAETLFTKTLAARRRLFGEENPQTLLTMGYLAELYERQGKYEQAEQLSARVLEVQRRVLGEQHPETLLSMNRLAVTYFRQNHYARAAELFSRVLEVQRRVLGEEHPNTLTTLSNLASMYVNLGDYKRAEPLRTRGLEVQRRVQGEQNPNTLTMVDNLGALYRAQGKYSEAESLFTRNLEARQRVLGPEHPDTLATMSNLAVTYLRQGSYSQAEPIARKVLEVRRRVLGLQHPTATDALIVVGLIQLHQRKYAEAESAVREALSSAEKTSPDHWRRYNSSCLLGAALAEQAKYTEAEPRLVSGYDGLAQRISTIPFENRSALDRCGTWIVELYENWGKMEKAAEWQSKLVQKPPG